MADYSFSRFNPRDFEHFIQALTRKILGNGTIVFGDGPDGGREATFNGTCPFPSVVDNWSGYWIIQAKYKGRSNSETDFNWIKAQFESEMNKFSEHQKKGVKLPNNYLFFTNVILTGVQDLGGRDKIEALAENYSGLIPNIHIFGYDDLCRFLDDNRDIAISYSSFTLPGDVLFELTNTLKEMNYCKTNHMELLSRFLEREFKEDMVSRLEQGGQLTDEKVNLEKVFIDLSVSNMDIRKRRSQVEKFIDKCILIGNSINKQDKSTLSVPNKMVLIGGPGQGKSTLTQFLCQIYRAHFLATNNQCVAMEEVSNFLKDYSELRKEEVTCIRFPVKIVLKDYAGWLLKNKEHGSIIEYLCYKFETKGKGEISLEEIRRLLSTLAFIFIFDGLDEVPSTSNRADIINEINDFLDIELRRQNCDALIIGTTRPQGYAKEFDNTKFEHYQLVDLSKDDCLRYLTRLIKNFDHSKEQQLKYQDILAQALQDSTIERLMKSPLQATIMAILVKSGGEPPRNRYNLFTQYYNTILNRERQKAVVKVLNDEYSDYIDLIHYKLGFTLQKNSEGVENPSSNINIIEFGDFAYELLTDEVGLDPDEAILFKNEILFAITDRLVFISEVEDSKVGFSIRSMQEYFAANYYLHNQPDNLIPEKISVIAKSAYWRNTVLFAMGYLAKYKSYLIDVVFSICCDLNGDNQDFSYITSEKVTKMGSWLALDLLCEGVFRSRQKDENKFCKLLEELFIVSPNEYHANFGRLPEGLQNKFVVKYVDEMLTRARTVKACISCWTIASHLLKQGNQIIIDSLDKHWPINNEEEVFLIKSMIYEGITESSWFLDKLLRSLEKNDIFIYFDELMNEEILINLSRKEVSPSIRGKFLELLFYFELEGIYFENSILYRLFNNWAGEEFFEIVDGEQVPPLFERTKEYRIELVPGYDIFFTSIGSTNENIIKLHKIYGIFNVTYLAALLNFYITPSDSNLDVFINELYDLDQKRIKILTHNKSQFNWVISKLLEVKIPINKNSFDIQRRKLGTKSDWIAFEKSIKEGTYDKSSLLESGFSGANLRLNRNLSENTFVRYLEDIYNPYAGNVDVEVRENVLNMCLINLFSFSYARETEKVDLSPPLLEEIANAIYNVPGEYGFFITRAWIDFISIITEQQLLDLQRDNEEIFNGIPAIMRVSYPISDLKEVYTKINSVLSIYRKETGLLRLMPTLINSQRGAERINLSKDSHKHLLERKYLISENENNRILIVSMLSGTDKSEQVDSILNWKENHMDMLEYFIQTLGKVNEVPDGVERIILEIHKSLKSDYEKNYILLSQCERYLRNVAENQPTSIRQL